MKYLKQTFEYLFLRGKGVRFVVLFAFALIPCAMLAYGFRLEGFITNIIFPGEYENLGVLLLAYIPNRYGIMSLCIGLLCAILTTACITDVVVRHFRVGDLSLKQISRSFNDYALPSVLYAAMSVAMYLVTFLVYALFEFMWYRFMAPIAFEVLSFITFFVLLSALIYVKSSLTLWLPTMCIKGVYARDSLAMAFYQSRTKQKYFLPVHIAASLILTVTAVASYFASKIWYISWIIDAVGYAVAYVIYMIFVLTAYFGENMLPREDVGVSPYKRRIR